MARFDIHEVRGGLALDCQADVLRRLPTRFVVPFEPVDPALMVSDQLNPCFAIDGRQFVMVTQLAGTVRTRELKQLVASLETIEDQLSAQSALDVLMNGV
jgi:toxin CcdB